MVEHLRGQHPRGLQLVRYGPPPVIPIQNRSLIDDTFKTASSAAFLALEETRGYIVAISIGGQLRVPYGSVSRGRQPIAQKNSSHSVKPYLLSFIFSSGNLTTKMENYRHRATEHPQVHASTRTYSYEPRSRNNRHRQEQVLLLARLRSPLRRCSVLLLALPSGILDGS